MTGQKKLEKPVNVQIASGSLLECLDFFPQLEWTADGTIFADTFRVLALGIYDGIVGLDWLSKYSPMTTHWA